MSEYKEPTYDCSLQLDENPAYEAMQKWQRCTILVFSGSYIITDSTDGG